MAGVMVTVVGLSLACGGEVSSADGPALSEPAAIDTRLMTALEEVVSNCGIDLSASSVICFSDSKHPAVAERKLRAIDEAPGPPRWQRRPPCAP